MEPRETSPFPFGLTDESIREIEERLARPRFRGVSIGAALGNHYYVKLALGRVPLDSRTLVTNQLRHVARWIRGPRSGSSQYQTIQKLRRPVLMTWQDERWSGREMALPVLHALGPERCIVLGRSPAQERYLPTITPLLVRDALPPIDMGLWRREYSQWIGAWKAAARAIVSDFRLPPGLLSHLVQDAAVQTQRVLSCEGLLSVLHPDVVVVEHDRAVEIAPLVLVAKLRGIPTLTLLHGVINRPCCFAPVLADVALCWGKSHQKRLRELGSTEEQLAVVGCQRLDRKLVASRNDALAKLGLPTDKRVVLFATNPLDEAHKQSMVRAFCESMSGQTHTLALVRVHPSETLDEYQNARSGFPAVRFLANEAWSLDEALAATDFLVCQDSGMGNDALVKGKPVVVFDVLPVATQNGTTLASEAGCPVARSGTELLLLLDRFSSDEGFRAGVRARAEAYVQAFCAAYGQAAAENVAAQVLSRLARAA